MPETFWLRQVEFWCEHQYQFIDPVTTKVERSALVQKLRELAASGLIQSARVAVFTG